MSIYFINIIKDIFATLLLTTYSMFGGSIEEKQVSVVNEENRNYFTIVTTIDTHEDTIKYNSNVIKLMLDEDYFKNKDERYDLFEPKVENNNFVKVE